MSSRALKQPLGPYTGSVPLCRGCHISISCSHFSSRCARMLWRTRARCERGWLPRPSQAASHTCTATHSCGSRHGITENELTWGKANIFQSNWGSRCSSLLDCYNILWKPRHLNRWVNRLISTWLHENDLSMKLFKHCRHVPPPGKPHTQARCHPARFVNLPPPTPPPK